MLLCRNQRRNMTLSSIKSRNQSWKIGPRPSCLRIPKYFTRSRQYSSYSSEWNIYLLMFIISHYLMTSYCPTTPRKKYSTYITTFIKKQKASQNSSWSVALIFFCDAVFFETLVYFSFVLEFHCRSLLILINFWLMAECRSGVYAQLLMSPSLYREDAYARSWDAVSLL